MTERDESAAEETHPDGSPNQDLRYSEQQEKNVRISRDLDGSGHLARGDRTHMSVLNFSSRHQTRTERDPDFAFRPPPKPKEAPAVEPPVAKLPDPPVPAAAPERPAVESPTTTPSLVAKIKGFLGL